MKETKVSLIITTSSLGLSELSSRLGRSHSGGSHDRGTPRLGGKSPWDQTIWRLDSAEPVVDLRRHCESIASQLPAHVVLRPGVLPEDSKVYLDIVVIFDDAMCTVAIPAECLDMAKSYKAEIQVTCYPGDFAESG